MASEVGHQHSVSGVTLYLLIRQLDQQIWNGAAFEPYVTANLGNYDIPSLGEQGTASRFYTFTFPAAISLGLFKFDILQQAGGAPAETDLIVGTGFIHWDGSVEVIPFDVIADEVIAASSSKVQLIDVDGLTDLSFREAMLSYILGKSALVDNGDGTFTITYNKQDGTTGKIEITYNLDGEWTPAPVIDPP